MRTNDQLLTIFYRLQILLLALLGFVLLLQIRFNGFVLSVEVAQVGNKILYHIHMRKRVDF